MGKQPLCASPVRGCDESCLTKANIIPVLEKTARRLLRDMSEPVWPFAVMQIKAQQISHLVCGLARKKCSETWGTFWTWTGEKITTLITWRTEEWRKEVGDIPPSKVRNDLRSTRQTLALFRGQPAERWGVVRKSLSERYNAILSWNWNSNIEAKLTSSRSGVVQVQKGRWTHWRRREQRRLSACSGCQCWKAGSASTATIHELMLYLPRVLFPGLKRESWGRWGEGGGRDWEREREREREREKEMGGVTREKEKRKTEIDRQSQ